MRLRRFAVLSAVVVGAVLVSGSIGSGTGLAAAPVPLAPAVPIAAAQPAVVQAPVVKAPVAPAPASVLRPEIIAHRGDHSQVVENSPAAIAQAISGGADAVEFDVITTADALPVVLHDPDLSKHTKNCTGLASRKTYRELRKCRRNDGRPIANLDEVLREIPTGKRAYVHLKTPPGRGMAGRLMTAVNAYGQNSDGTVTFFSSSPKVLEELRDAGALSLGLIFNAQNEAAGWASDYPVLIPYRVAVSAAEVRAAHARGQLVIAVSGLPMSTSRALALGVDGFMADNLAKALRKLG